MSYSDGDMLDPLNNPDTKITFKDGSTVFLFYGYGGQRRINQKYGDLNAFFKKLSPERPKDANGVTIPRPKDESGEEYEDGLTPMPDFEAIVDAIVIGGWHAGLTVDKVEDPRAGLDSRQVEDHMKAIEAALVLSFPTQMSKQAPATSETPGTSAGTQLAAVPPSSDYGNTNASAPPAPQAQALPTTGVPPTTPSPWSSVPAGPSPSSGT